MLALLLLLSCFRVSARGGTLEGSLNSIEHFDTSLANYLAWMAATEERLADQDKRSTEEEVMEGEESLTQLQTQFKVSEVKVTSMVCMDPPKPFKMVYSKNVVKGYQKILEYRPFSYDNNMFRLHYKTMTHHV